MKRTLAFGFLQINLSNHTVWSIGLSLVLIIVDLCWLVPWYQTLLRIRYVAPAPGVAVVLGSVMVFACFIASFGGYLRLVPGIQNSLSFFGFMLCVFVASQILLNSSLAQVIQGIGVVDAAEVLVILFVTWGWWRGGKLGMDTVRPLFVWRWFITGIFFYLAHEIIVFYLKEETWGLAGFAMFLFWGLLSMVLSRIENVNLWHGARKTPFHRGWVFSVVGLVFFLVVAAFLLAGLLTGQYSILLDYTAEVVHWIILGVLFVLSIPWVLLATLFEPLIPLLRSNAPTPTPVAQTVENIYPEAGALPMLPPKEVIPISKQFELIVFWIIVTVIVVSLLWTRRRLLSRSRLEDEETENLLDRNQLAGRLKKSLQAQLDSLTHGFNQLFRPIRSRIDKAHVRWIYFQVLDLAADLGAPRPIQLTPNEFLPVLGELLPGSIHELSLITRAFIQVRYAEIPEDGMDLRALEVAWAKIDEEGKRLKQARLKPLITTDTSETRRIGT